MAPSVRGHHQAHKRGSACAFQQVHGTEFHCLKTENKPFSADSHRARRQRPALSIGSFEARAFLPEFIEDFGNHQDSFMSLKTALHIDADDISRDEQESYAILCRSSQTEQRRKPNAEGL